MNGVDRFEQLVEVLEQIEMLLLDDMSAGTDDVRTRLAVERLWITAGNLAEVHRMAAGMDAGVEPQATRQAVKGCCTGSGWAWGPWGHPPGRAR